jgi:antitoxin component YwqK of YwqJK toxin-antitoxin module
MQINKIPKDADGKSHGLWEQYFDNGQLWFKGEYIHNMFHGPWVWYYDNGQLWCKETYDMGNEIKYGIEYNKRGILRYKRFYAR